ncbi:hypothetical protein SS322685_5404 [Shigella sonnei 3226-85]|nr:hypothetical protein SS322685_5404 [Shigella sonnei 3226-85]
MNFASVLPEGAAGSWGIVYDEKGKTIKRKVEATEGKLQK